MYNILSQVDVNCGYTAVRATMGSWYTTSFHFYSEQLGIENKLSSSDGLEGLEEGEKGLKN